MSKKTKKEWTIMVYMAGDNNLSEYMAHQLGDICDVGADLGSSKNNKANLLAFIDSSSLTAPTHYIDYSDGKNPFRHKIEAKDLVFKNRHKTGRDTLQGGENSASFYSILNFVNWCINTQGRKANNYAL